MIPLTSSTWHLSLLRPPKFGKKCHVSSNKICSFVKLNFHPLIIIPNHSDQKFSKTNSGKFRNGMSVKIFKRLPAGTYHIIPSTFEPGQCGKFFLTVGSTNRIKIARKSWWCRFSLDLCDVSKGFSRSRSHVQIRIEKNLMLLLLILILIFGYSLYFWSANSHWLLC